MTDDSEGCVGCLLAPVRAFIDIFIAVWSVIFALFAVVVSVWVGLFLIVIALAVVIALVEWLGGV